MAVNHFPTRPDDAAGHADHDALLIVAFAEGALTDAEAAGAAAIVASCPACARLADDVRLLRTAVRALPAAARPRDFRLTEADAARLRRTGWRRFLVPLAAPRFAFTRPLAGALVTLGLAGILVTAVPGVLQAPGQILSTVGNSVTLQESAAGDTAAGGAAAGAAAAPGSSSGLTTAGGAAAAAPSPAVEPSLAAAPSVAAAAPALTAAPSPAMAPQRAGASAVPGATLPAEATAPFAAAASASAATDKSAEAGSLGAAPVPMGVGSQASGPPLLLIAAVVLLLAGLGLAVLRLVAGRLA